MTKTARPYKIEQLIRHRGSVTFAQLLQTLEVSPATLKRDLEYLRDQLGAPIEYDRDSNGYRLAAGAAAWRGEKHELPGLWFSERELYSLLMAHQVLSGLDAEGTLSRHLQPLLDRIHELLGPGGESDAKALMKRVKIISALRRPVPPECFERMGEALLRRRRLHLRYLTRGRGEVGECEVGEREVSPQRLVHHKNTWYLDAWCHQRERLLRQVEAEMDTGYGIFAGGTVQQAVLRFSPQAAPWISREEWHPAQQGRLLADGSWELSLPYVDETELVMDLLRQGEQVRVLAPDSLAQAVQRRLAAALAIYAEPAP